MRFLIGVGLFLLLWICITSASLHEKYRGGRGGGRDRLDERDEREDRSDDDRVGDQYGMRDPLFTEQEWKDLVQVNRSGTIAYCGLCSACLNKVKACHSMCKMCASNTGCGTPVCNLPVIKPKEPVVLNSTSTFANQSVLNED